MFINYFLSLFTNEDDCENGFSTVSILTAAFKGGVITSTISKERIRFFFGFQNFKFTNREKMLVSGEDFSAINFGVSQ